MEKLLFRKLITDISFRALTITFAIGLIVWIIQAVNYLDFVIDDGHNFKIYFLYNLHNFPKIVHRILPFVFAISVYFELIKYEKNNELLIFWTNGVTKKKFVHSLLNFAVLVMFLQIIMGSFISPNSQLKARTFLKNSNMDFLPNLIKQGKFIDIVSGLTIFISEKTEVNSFKNIYIQEGDSFSLEKNNNQIIFAKKGYLVDGNEKLFRLLDGKIVSINNDNRLISFEFDKIDYDLSNFSSKTIKIAKIQELPSYKILQCSLSLMNNKPYIEKMFICEKSRLKNLNQEIYKRLIKPMFIPLLTLVCCFLLTFSKVQNNFTIKTIKIFLYLLIILILSETLMRYVGETKAFLIIFLSLPMLLFFTIFNFLKSKIKYDENF